MSILKSIVMNRDRMAKFSHAIAYNTIENEDDEGNLTYHNGCNLYYKVDSDDGDQYEFPIDMGDYYDVGSTAFDAEIKATTLMRYIRKAIENETLVKLTY